DTGQSAVERNLLTAFFLDLDDQIDIAFLLVRADLDIAVLIDWIKILRLIKPDERDLKIILIVYITLIQQKLTPHHLVACKRISCKLEPAQSKLFALVYRDRDIDDSLV